MDQLGALGETNSMPPPAKAEPSRPDVSSSCAFSETLLKRYFLAFAYHSIPAFETCLLMLHG